VFYTLFISFICLCHEGHWNGKPKVITWKCCEVNLRKMYVFLSQFHSWSEVARLNSRKKIGGNYYKPNSRRGAGFAQRQKFLHGH